MPEAIDKLLAEQSAKQHYAKVEFDEAGGFKIDIHNVGIQEMLFAASLLQRTAYRMMDQVDLQNAIAAQQMAAVKQDLKRTD